MKKKKVLFFVEAMGGGVFTYIVNLANELCEEYDMYIAYATRPQTPKDYKKYFNKKVHLIKVKNYRRKISIIYDVKAFFEMKKICKLVKPDIVHLHSSKSGILGRIAFSGRKYPVFYTPHGYSFLMKGISRRKKAFYLLLERFAAFGNSTTISCSYGENEETKKLTRRALYVNNGINLDKIKENIGPYKKDNKINFIFTIGRISTQKDPVMFNSIAEKFPNIRFVWIGDGNLRDKLTSPNILITGWKKEDEALKIASEGSIFLLTSKWEGLPMSLLEAMYMKKVCIASNVIGNNNVIRNNENGFLCNNLEEYVSTIESIINGEPTNKIVSNAHEDVVHNYNSRVMAKKYSKIYQKALYKENNNEKIKDSTCRVD